MCEDISGLANDGVGRSCQLKLGQIEEGVYRMVPTACF